MVVLHYTAMLGADAAADRLCDPGAEVSAHYLVAADGAVLALVPEELRAWHAGASAWGGVADVNSRSIGIELDNPGHQLGYPPYPEPQMAALETLLAGILARWAIPPERVVGHACIAPGRKRDPGEKLDWRRLASRGLAVWLDVPMGGGAPGRGGPGKPAAGGGPIGCGPIGCGPTGCWPTGCWPTVAGPTVAGPTGCGPTGCGPTGCGPTVAGHPPAGGCPADAGRFRAAARAFGYPVDGAAGWTQALGAVWHSFAMRFRPHEPRSEPHEAGIRHLEALAARWPVAPDRSPRSPSGAA
jgi:N-acetylmuramoyl-L-alanine amidase